MTTDEKCEILRKALLRLIHSIPSKAYIDCAGAIAHASKTLKDTLEEEEEST